MRSLVTVAAAALAATAVSMSGYLLAATANETPAAKPKSEPVSTLLPAAGGDEQRSPLRLADAQTPKAQHARTAEDPAADGPATGAELGGGTDTAGTLEADQPTSSGGTSTGGTGGSSSSGGDPVSEPEPEPDIADVPQTPNPAPPAPDLPTEPNQEG